MVNLANLKQWSKTGLNANKDLYNFASSATNNPTQYLDNLMSSYQGSDIFNRKVNNMSDFFRNQMASRGLNGSNYSDDKLMQNISNLVNDDMQGYLTNAMNVLNSGANNLNNLSNTGMQAENNIQDLMLQDEALQEQKNSWWKDILKTGAGAAFGALTGGSSMMLGNIMADKIGNWYGRNNPNSSFGIKNNFYNMLNQNPHAMMQYFTNGGNQIASAR